MRRKLEEEAALERARSRLALSRSEWVAHMRGSSFPSGGDERPPGHSDMGDMLGTWWRRHPLKLALDVIRPVLRHQAREHPTGLLALAALAGAALMLLRPWRALPVAGWIALRAMPLEAWLGALRKMLDPGHDQHGRRPPSA